MKRNFGKGLISVCLACGWVGIGFALDYPDAVGGVVTVTEAGEYAGDFPSGMSELVVNASGTVTISKAHSSYAGKVTVKSGTTLKAAYMTALGGSAQAAVNVESGATLLLTEAQTDSVPSQGTSYFLPALTIAGTGADGKGALSYVPSTSTGKCADSLVSSLKLLDDATIRVAQRYGIKTIDPNGHTLTRVGTSTWMMYYSVLKPGHVINKEGTLTVQGGSFTGTGDDSSLTIAGGLLSFWNTQYDIPIPVILSGGYVYAGSGAGSNGTAKNRITGELTITNSLPTNGSAQGNGKRSPLNFVGPVTVGTPGKVLFNNDGTNTFFSTLTVRESAKLAIGAYHMKDAVICETNLEVTGYGAVFEKGVTARYGAIWTSSLDAHFKDSITMPRAKDFTVSNDAYFEGNVNRRIGGLVLSASGGSLTLDDGGYLSARMLRVSNGGAGCAVFRNKNGHFVNDIGDIGYIGESTGSMGVFVLESGGMLTLSNSLNIASSRNSYGFLCQKGGLFTHRNTGYLNIGRYGNGFLWVTGGTNDSHFSTQNSSRTRMSEFCGTSTLVVSGEGSLFRTDSLIAGCTTNATTNVVAVINGGTLQAHRFYAIDDRADGTVATAQVDGGTVMPSFFSGWGDANLSSDKFYRRTFGSFVVHSGGIVMDTTGCVNDQGGESGSVNVAHNFARPGGRGIKSIALPDDETFAALNYRGPVPIVFEGPGYGATAYADFDFTTRKLTGVVVGSSGCDYTEASRAYVLAPSANPDKSKRECTITLTDDNRPAGPFVKRGAKVELSLYGTNDCSSVTVESGTLSMMNPRAVPQHVPVNVWRGARLYLNGGTFAVSSLEGEGTLENAGIALDDGGTIRVTAAKAFAGGATPLTCGTLTFGSGTKVVVTDPENLPEYLQSKSATIVSAAGFVGDLPTLELPSGTAGGWRVYRYGNTLRFGAPHGTTMILR